MDRTKIFIGLGMLLAGGTAWTLDREIVEFIDDILFAIVSTLYEMVD